MMRYLCTFVLSKDGGEDAPLRCRLKWNGSREIVSVNVGYRVNPKKWDGSTQRCVLRSFHGKRRVPAATINREIERFEKAAEAVFSRFPDDAWPTGEEVRKAFRTELGIDDAPTGTGVWQAYALFLADGCMRSAWSKATVQKFNTMKAHVTDFDDSVTFDGSFGTEWLTRYVAFLREDAELRNSSIEKHLSYLRWFLRWCADKGYMKDRTFDSFRPKLKNTQNRVIFLTWDELMMVWNFVPPADRPYLARVRDIFCFCAFTSLRYSDAIALTWTDVGAKTISVTTQKTADSLDIELNKWSSEILSRWVDPDEPVPGGYVFPRVANQVMNRDLKDICRMVGIDDKIRVTYYKGSERVDEVHPKWELVGTHCARRTFICNALTMGIAPSVVMQWTGHSDYRAMKPYIAIADEAKASAMGLFDEKQ